MFDICVAGYPSSSEQNVDALGCSYMSQPVHCYVDTLAYLFYNVTLLTYILNHMMTVHWVLGLNGATFQNLLM